MFPSLLLLIQLAFCGVARSTLDIGPAWIDVDVSMSLGHQTSSTLPATAFAGTTSTTLNLDWPTEHPKTTHSPLNPYSRATSYIGSAWYELNDALRDSETLTSSLNFASAATSSTVDGTKRSEAATVRSPQSSIIDLSHHPHSIYATSTKACDDSATTRPSLLASASGPAAPASASNSNGTDSWMWPPVVSTWPSSSTHSGISNHSNSPTIHSGNADGKPTVTIWACWMMGALILSGEARGML